MKGKILTLIIIPILLLASNNNVKALDYGYYYPLPYDTELTQSNFYINLTNTPSWTGLVLSCRQTYENGYTNCPQTLEYQGQNVKVRKIILWTWDNNQNIRGDITGNQSIFGLPAPDGEVDIFDLLFVSSRYGKNIQNGNWDNLCYLADLQQDGVIDILDISIVSSNYGKTTSYSIDFTDRIVYLEPSCIDGISHVIKNKDFFEAKIVCWDTWTARWITVDTFRVTFVYFVCDYPEGYWYGGVDFDPDPSNYAIVQNGRAYLRAYSYATFWWEDVRGWSNAFIHQGKMPYSMGIQAGRFKDGWLSNPVLGIRYELWDENGNIKQEPTGMKLEIRLRITKRYVNSINAFASVLFFALFQYEDDDGCLSDYDLPAKTSDFQSLHYDIFLSRAQRFAGFYWEHNNGTENWDWGDAYNDDLHVQRVVGQMDVGQWYTFVLDWGFLINRAKEMFVEAYYHTYWVRPTFIDALILRWIGLSAEVIGSELEVEVDYIRFYDTWGQA